MMVLKRFGKVLLCGARQAMVKRSNRIGAVIMEEDGMAIGKMAKLLVPKEASFSVDIVLIATIRMTFAELIEG